MDYQYTATLADGSTLVVAALQPEWMGMCADLLANSFIAAANILPYGRFVRRQIGAYLDEHIRLPPKAVVLMAVLEYPGLDGQEQDGCPGSTPAVTTSNSTTTSSSSSSSSSNNNDIISSSSSSSNFGRIFLSKTRGQDTSSRGGAPSTAPSGDDGSGGGQQQGRRRRVLVGTGEVSFRPSTRSSYLTLNPPAKGGYICNMAVAPEMRRKGVASHLMIALEEVACMAGEQYAYLHLRFRDDAGAGALYRGLGYEEYGKDGIWVGLLGQERRWLMRKQIGRRDDS